MNNKLLLITQKVDSNDPFLGFFVKWIAELAKYFEEIRVLCLSKGRFFLPNNVKVISFGKEIGAGRIKMLQNFLKRITSEALRTDAFFVHMTPIWVVLGGPVFRMLGKPVFLWYTHKSVPLSLRAAERLCTRIFTASRESFRLKSRKVCVLSHGIDIDFFNFHHRTPGRVCKLISVSRITKSKNIHLLIQAFAGFHKFNKRSTLAIVGGPITHHDFAYLNEAKLLVKKLGLSKAVTFVGTKTQNQLLLLLHNADLFVNLSTTGSLDKAVLEVMSTGLPVVTSNEAFRFVKGVIFVKNNITSIVKGFERCAYMPDALRKKQTKMLRKYAEKNSLNVLISKMSAEMLKDIRKS